MESTSDHFIRGGKPPLFKSPYDSREELTGGPGGGYLSPPETEVNSPFGRFQQSVDPKLVQMQYPSTPLGQPVQIQNPTQPLQQNRHSSASAPQTPLNEFFIVPNGTMPNGISIAYQPVPTNLSPAYSLGRLPDHLSQSKFDLYDNKNAANATGGSLGVGGGGVLSRSQSMRRHQESIGPPHEDEKWYLCQLCLRFLLRSFSSTVKSVSYSDDDGLPAAATNDSSFKTFAEETTMHGIK